MPRYANSDGAPQILYHATYAPYLVSIREHGIGGQSGIKNYEDSENGIVYLATDRNIAISYAETSEQVPEDFLENIVVLSVNLASLDASKLRIDRNVQTENPEQNQTFEYHGVIRQFEVLPCRIPEKCHE